MSATQESLLFTVKVQSTGISAAQIDAIAKSLKNLSTIKVTGLAGDIFKGITTGTKSAESGLNSVVAAGNKADGMFQKMGASTKQVATGLSGVNAESSKLAAGLNRVDAAAVAVQGGLTKVNTVLTQYNSSGKQVNTVNESIVGSASALGGVLARVKSQYEASAVAEQQFASAGRSVVTTNQQIAGSHAQLGTSLNTSTGALKQHSQEITNYISRSAGMFISIVGLNQAVEESVGMQQAAGEAAARLSEAEANLAAVKADSSSTTRELTAATKEVADAKKAETVITRNAAFAYSDQLYFVALLATELSGVLVSALRNGAQTMEVMRTAATALTGAFTSLGTGTGTFFKTFATGTKTLDKSATGFINVADSTKKSTAAFKEHVGVAGPLGGLYTTLGNSTTKLTEEHGKAYTAATRLRGGFASLGSAIGSAGGGGAGLLAGFAALAVGMALYSTNVGGARDRLNEFGVSVGQAVPALKPFGDALMGILGTFELTGETALQTKEHFAEAAKGFDSWGSQWNSMVQGMMADNSALIQSLGFVLEKFGEFGQNMLKDPLGTTLKNVIPGGSVISDQIDEAQKKAHEGMKEAIPGLTIIDTNKIDYDSIKNSNTALDKNNQLIKDNAKNRGIYSGAIKGNTEDVDKDTSALGNNKFFQEKVRNEMDLLKTSTSDMNQVLGDHLGANALVGLGYEQVKNELAAMGVELQTNIGHQQAYTEALSTQAFQQNLIMEGSQQRKQAEIDLRTENMKNIGVIKEWNSQLGNSLYQGQQVEAGIQSQQIQYLKLRDSILFNNGAIIEYNKQLQSQQFINDQVTAGFQKQQLAFNDQEVAIANSIGALAAYGQAYESGRLQQMSFVEGMVQQEQKFFDMVKATEEAKGAYERLGQQMSTGIAQQEAFANGFAETQLAIRQQTVDLEKAKGSMNAYIAGIQSGVVQQNAMTQGVLDQRQALIDSYTEMYRSNSALQEYNKQLATGLPQGIAFQQTIIDMNRATAEQGVELAKAAAAVQYNGQVLSKYIDTTKQAKIDLNDFGDSANQLFTTFDTAAATSFLKGVDAVDTWVLGLKDAAHEQAGFRTGLLNLAGSLGVLPEALNMSSEALQKFLELTLKAPSAIKEFGSELKGIFDEMIGGLSDALATGEDELNNAVDELSKKLKIKFNKGVSEALEFQAGSDLFGKASKQLGALFIGIGNNLNASDFEGLKKGITGRLSEIMDGVAGDADSTIGPKVTGIMQKIIGQFNNFTAEDMKKPTEIAKFMGELGANLINLQGQTDNFSKAWESMSTALAEGDLKAANAAILEMQQNAVAFTELKWDSVSGQLKEVSVAAEVVRDDIKEIAKQYGDSVQEIMDKAQALKQIGLGAMQNLQGNKEDSTSMINMVGATEEDKKKFAGLGKTQEQIDAEGGGDKATGEVDKMKQSVVELTSLFTGLGKVVGIVFQGITEVSGITAQGLISVFTPAITGLITLFGSIPTAANVAFGGMLKVWGIIVTNMGTVFDLFIGNFTKQLTTVMTGATVAFGTMLVNWGTTLITMGATFGTFATNLGTMLTTTITYATATFNTMLVNWGTTLITMGATFGTFATNLGTMLTTILTYATATFNTMVLSFRYLLLRQCLILLLL